MDKNVRTQRVLEISCYIAAAILLVAFGYMSTRIFVADSEFWSVAMGYHLFEEIKNNWVFTRPLFYGLLWVSQRFYSIPSESIFWARLVFALNGMLILYLLFCLSKKISRSTVVGAVAIFLVLSNTGFINQGFRIRSDLLATTLTLISWILLTSSNQKKMWTLFLPLLATPKAIFFSLSLMVTFVRPQRVRGSHLISLSLLGLLIVALNWNNAAYFFESFGWGEVTFYFTAESFYHLKMQLVRNPWFWMLFMARVFTRQLVRSRRIPKDTAGDRWEQKYDVFIFACLVFMVFSTEKVQYFIASFLPFFALYAALLVQDLRTLGVSERWQNGLIATTLVLGLYGGGYWAITNLERNSNRNQMKVLDSLNDFLTLKEIDSIQDFNCLLPVHCKSRHFIGPHQTKWNYAALDLLVREKPDIFFYLKKAGLLEPKLRLFLNENYVDLGHGIFVRKEEMSHSDPKTSERLQIEKSLAEKTVGITQVVRGSMFDLFGYDVDY